MMIFARRSFIAIAFYVVLLPGIITAQATSEDTSDQTMDQIFEAIPLEGPLTESPEELHNQFSQNPFGLPASQNQQMMDLFQEAFASDSLLEDAKKAFQQNYSDQYADPTLDWLNSESTNTILEAQSEFYSLQGIRKRIVNKYELEQDPAPDERVKLIESLAEEKSAAESEIESQVIIFRALVSAFGELSNKPIGESQIEGMVANFRSQNQSQINQGAINQLLLMYHGLENQALKNQISFFESEAGKWLNETKTESIHAAYQSAADRFLDSISNL